MSSCSYDATPRTVSEPDRQEVADSVQLMDNATQAKAELNSLVRLSQYDTQNLAQGPKMKKILDNKSRSKSDRAMIKRFSTRDMEPNPRGVK